MSKRNKLLKFADLQTFPNVYENYRHDRPALCGLHGEPVELRGKWSEQHFGNARPITLELACGRGEYTLGMARQNPERNFIGVDVKGARIWQGARIALAEGLHNAAFLRTRIEQIAAFFAPGEASEIWITFPDPFPPKSKTKRRLTGPAFLREYQKILRPGGLLHLKTDDQPLYEFSLEALSAFPGATLLYQDDDIYAKPLPLPELELKTYYERLHLDEGKTIKYIRSSLS